MLIDGEKLSTVDVFRSFMTVPDCIVVSSNKLGSGHGEKKFYISSKNEMHAFYGKENFSAPCFMLRSDLISYMIAIKNEYENPSLNYRGKDELPRLWKERLNKINSLSEVISFNIYDQNQIEGDRGYINSDDAGYQLIREIALPLVSYVYVEKMNAKGSTIYYWKLFVDFDLINEKENGPLVFQYGKAKEKNKDNQEDQRISAKEEKKREEIRKARDGQGKYRESLIDQCKFCPITMVADERLLIASHIKPWAASDDNEKTDPYNGYLLTPLYDKLFDRGFITFTEDRRMILSEFITSYTWKRLGIKNNTLIQALPMDDKRIKYLDFHHKAVFKGSFDDENMATVRN